MKILERYQSALRSKRFIRSKNRLVYFFQVFLLGTSVGFLVELIYPFFSSQPSTFFDYIEVKTQFGVIVQLHNLLTLNPINYLSVYKIILLGLVTCLLIKNRKKILDLCLFLLGLMTWFLINKYQPISIYSFNFKQLISWDLVLYASIVFFLLNIAFFVLSLIIRRMLIEPDLVLRTKKKEINLNIVKTLIIKLKINWKRLQEIFNRDPRPQRLDEPLKNMEDVEIIKNFIGNQNLFENFVTNINTLKTVINDNDNFGDTAKTICVDSPWGSGKTSLINIIKNEVINEKSPEVVWIDFNPWSFNNRNELIEDFFKTLNAKLIEEYGINLGSNLKKYIELITPAAESFSFSGFIKTFLNFQPFRSKNIQELKDSLKSSLKDIPVSEKIVIALDDIDRLQYREVLIVLQLVRQLSNFPNILFILPFDFNRIDSLIADKKGGAHRNFLKKIINTRLGLEPYSYEELESIFIYSTYADQEQGIIPNKIKENLKEVFDFYCLKKSELVFTDIRKQEDSSEAKTENLKPMFDFILPLFHLLYPDKSFDQNFAESKNRLNSVINGLYARNYRNFDHLVKDLVGGFSIFRRNEINGQIEQRFVEIQNKITQYPSEITTLKDSIKEIMSGQEKIQSFQSVKQELDQFQNNQAPFSAIVADKDAKSSWDEILILLDKYNKDFFQSNSSLFSDTKSWLLAKITPRQIKCIARDINHYSSKSIDELSIEEMKSRINQTVDLY